MHKIQRYYFIISLYLGMAALVFKPVGYGLFVGQISLSCIVLEKVIEKFFDKLVK